MSKNNDDTFTFPIEASHILMFARAVADEDSGYVGADGPKFVPPTFLQAAAQFNPDYPLRPKGHSTWFGSGGLASGLLKEGAQNKEENKSEASDEEALGNRAGMLHAEQHFEFHSYPKAGDVLEVSTRPGKKWERESKRAGLLKFSETIVEYRNKATGELVATATNVGVVTEKVVEQ